MKPYYILPLFAFSVSVLAADFKNEDVAGQRISLIDAKKIETYGLGKNGMVLAEFGVQGGPITGPACRWRIEKGKLLIEDGSAVMEAFQLIARKGNILTVRCKNGETAAFEIEPLSSSASLYDLQGHPTPYLKRMTETIDHQWARIMDNSPAGHYSGGTVVVSFVLNSKGGISRIVKVDAPPGMPDDAKQACLAAITARAPYGEWTADMISAYGSEQELKFTFKYQ